MMPSEAMFPTVVEVLTPTEGTDPYGNTAHEFAAPSRRFVRANVQPGPTSEARERGLTTRVDLTVFTRYGLEARERVVYGGETFEVHAPPEVWRGYCVSSLVRVEG